MVSTRAALVLHPFLLCVLLTARGNVGRRPEPEECGECKQKVAVAAQLRKQLGEGQVAGKDDPRGEIKLSEQEIETITRESAGLDCSEVCPEVSLLMSSTTTCLTTSTSTSTSPAFGLWQFNLAYKQACVRLFKV